MSPPSWAARVYRLRRLPHHITDASEAARLLGEALGIPPEDVVVYSVAHTFNRLESPPSKVATLQLKSSPSSVELYDGKDEWKISLPGTLDYLLLDTHFLGMTVLNHVDPKSHHTDCIAISGLASHPFGSWQPHGDDKTFMWIRDEASRLISGTRMLLYGYNSQLIKSESFQKIGDISLGLIHQLKYGGWGLPSSKPIVFLAHSLGGIVLKDAILQIAGLQLYASILDKVKGAIMFGVPSLGMHQSHLMMMTEGRPNEILVQDLSRDNGSAYLRDLNTRFDGLAFLKRATIYWAYETKESVTAALQPDGTWAKNGSPEVLVNPDSATSYRNTKNKIMTIPIDKDHSGMVKFSSGDRDLETILLILAELCDDQQSRGGEMVSEAQVEVEVEDTELKIHKPMSASEQEAFRMLRKYLSLENKMYTELQSRELHTRVDQIENPYENTFSWIFELPSFCSWLQGGSGLFWINGKPGSGKSTLMKYIYQSKTTWQLLHSWTRSTAEVKELQAGFFFHYRGTPLQKSFEGLLRSLILQIFNQMDSFRKRWGEFESLDGFESKTIKEIEKLRRMMHLPDAGPKAMTPMEIEENLRQEEEKLDRCRRTMSRILTDFKPFQDLPTTKYLIRVVAEYHNSTEGWIPRLERILRLLLYQEVVKMDVVLFFDALDEYDGHTDMISQFLHNLVQASTSNVRVKICFSSRPWKALLKQFSDAPGLSLQDHTQEDIEMYAAGRLGGSTDPTGDILSLVPVIVAKASGVFVWVRLAVTEIVNLSTSENNTRSVKDMEKLLLELPDDLHSFYELIVERIAVTHRRNTFALLELIIRQDSPQTVRAIWLAVQISRCVTLETAIPYIDTIDAPAYSKQRYKGDMQSDILAWGGGLVEIRGSQVQLMHQTVLEFVLSVSFKRAVLGNLATVVTENGHSYHVKFLIATEIRNIRYSQYMPPENSTQYHSQQSELTTGQSQLPFLESVPQDELYILATKTNYFPSHPEVPSIPVYASFHGLALCLKRWLEENPRTLGNIPAEVSYCPLLYNLFFAGGQERYQDRYVEMARLLLDNGFDPNRDRDFFHALVTRIWDRSLEEDEVGDRIPLSALCQLVDLVLSHGQDPNIFKRFGARGETTALATAPPVLAAELIRHGADPNCYKTTGDSPLSWVMRPEYILTTTTNIGSTDEWRYKVIGILLKAGAIIKPDDHEPMRMWLSKFHSEGYDVRTLLEICAARGCQVSLRTRTPQQFMPPPERERHLSTSPYQGGREEGRGRRGEGPYRLPVGEESDRLSMQLASLQVASFQGNLRVEQEEKKQGLRQKAKRLLRWR
ncbi:unnamed protein product [Clonostachys rosea]|uniref:Nephrocystin 3-like N-terminal domain-containing protein n=1 Tax=Bionectria ochroleuca TaxID=29856 RepID=A0ABY6U502_BIOOC|nr:unnamed protein product [Clonostachys rosea]